MIYEFLIESTNTAHVLYKTTSKSSSGMTPKQIIENQENTETTQVNGMSVTYRYFIHILI